MNENLPLPFRPEFEAAMTSGKKTCTARTKRMGQPGDIFRAFGHAFQIDSVEDTALEEVALLWKEEGCASRDDFIRIWNQIHPRKPFSGTTRVYLHRFRMVWVFEEEKP